MSTKANPAVVGSFVLGAVALAIGGLFFFGGGKFFRTTETFVAFFQGSLKGLEIGAPVSFRGVRLGTVRGIDIVYDTDTNELSIPVIFELELNRMSLVGKRAYEAGADDDVDDNDLLIERGLRAQLVMRSMVTGQLAVDLDFFPDSEVVLRGGYQDYEEYPTVPSDTERLRNFFENLANRMQEANLEELVPEVMSLLENVNKLVTSEDLSNALAGADRLINSPDLAASVTSLRRALDNADAAMRSVRKLADDADGEIVPLVASLKTASNELGEILGDAGKVLNSVQASLDEDSDLRVRTINVMQEVAAAARAVRILADYLERHPEAFLKGKTSGGEQ
ncbi:MAG: MlaD family protein [Gammaproteobacteria bacterium]|jgi:paraquat-inducible protein B